MSVGLAVTRAALIAALVACLGLVGALWWAIGARDDARAEIAALERQAAGFRLVLDGMAQAAAVHRAHMQRMEQEAAEMAALLADLETMGGQDAPLSDLLGPVGLGRVWAGD